jgi:hypothetical protein
MPCETVELLRGDAQWTAIAVRPSPHWPGACRSQWAHAKVAPRTSPMGIGSCAWSGVGDGDVDWEEVAAAVGPHQTAVSRCSR